MKKMVFSILCGLILLFPAVSTQAAEPTKNQITALFGRDLSSFTGNYILSKQFDLAGEYKDNALKAGIAYHWSDAFKITAGVRYEPNQQATVAFERFDFMLPFGDNLKFDGYYVNNYDGFDWSQYETAFRIEVFDKQYIRAGVRGDFGDGAPRYSYNPDLEPFFFLKGNFYWKTGKFDFALQPYLLIRGVWFDDYTVKYYFNQNIALALNYRTDFNQMSYLLGGIQWRF